MSVLCCCAHCPMSTSGLIELLLSKVQKSLNKVINVQDDYVSVSCYIGHILDLTKETNTYLIRNISRFLAFLVNVHVD